MVSGGPRGSQGVERASRGWEFGILRPPAFLLEFPNFEMLGEFNNIKICFGRFWDYKICPKPLFGKKSLFSKLA